MNGTCLNLLEEAACGVAVHHDGSDCRLAHLLLVRVFALLLVDNGIVVVLQIFIGKVHDILFGQLRHAVQGGDFVGPVASVYK